jgi:CHASE3 domain sensor protein
VQLNHKLSAEQGRIAHTLQVSATIDHVLTLQLNAETSVRGYLLTSDPLYLQPYTTAQNELPATLAALTTLVQDNPAQVARAQEASTLIAREMTILATLQATTQIGNDPTAEQLAASKRQMDELRVELGAMTDEETTLLGARRMEAQRLARRAQAVGVLAIVIGLIGSLLASLLFTKGIGGGSSASARRRPRSPRAARPMPPRPAGTRSGC